MQVLLETLTASTAWGQDVFRGDSRESRRGNICSALPCPTHLHTEG